MPVELTAEVEQDADLAWPRAGGFDRRRKHLGVIVGRELPARL
jgi:hypothetical protein